MITDFYHVGKPPITASGLRGDIRGFTERATTRLTYDRWPGNVRQLQDTISEAVATHYRYLPDTIDPRGSNGR